MDGWIGWEREREREREMWVFGVTVTLGFKNFDGLRKFLLAEVVERMIDR